MRCFSCAHEGLPVSRQQGVDQVEAGDPHGRLQVGQAAAARQQVQLAVEDDDQQQPQPEGRRGDAGDGEGAHHLVHRLVAVDRRQDAQGDAHQGRQEQGHQGQFQGGREEGTQVLQHRPVGADGGAQVAVRRAGSASTAPTAAGPGPSAPDVADDLVGGPVPGDQPGRVARDEVRDDEGDDRDAQHHQQQEEQAFANDIDRRHGVLSSSGTTADATGVEVRHAARGLHA